MLYFKEVTEFLRWHKDLEFKMIQLVRMLNGNPEDKQEWERKRKAIRRVMDELVRLGFVTEKRSQSVTGGFKRYQWKETGTRDSPIPVDKPGQ